MVITYLGLEAFKVQLGDLVIAYNPISKDSSLKASKFGSDLVLVSINHPDMNGIENVTFGEKKPFVISGPGEYEIRGIFIKGFPSETSYGKGKRTNTIYTMSLENMNLCFLGALDSKQLADDTKEALDGIDILFVPVGGEGVLDLHDANKLAVSLEPKIIIPMHYDEKQLKLFLKEADALDAKPIDKLTIKKKDLEGKEADVVVLSPAT